MWAADTAGHRLGIELEELGADRARVRMASRLADEATGGQILVTQRLYAEVEARVDAAPAGDYTLKGFSRPVAAFSVLALR